jgi:uncharacterized protein
MIHREKHLARLDALLSRHKVVGVVGARQVGKTTLVHEFARRRGDVCTYFDLERAEDLARLQEPELGLSKLRGLVIIDEVQRHGGLFEALRVLADRRRSATRFLVLGSASPEMLRQSSETLAGRIVYHELGGFSLDEIGPENHARLWLRGGFPRAYLSRTHAASHEWRQGFVRTFLERDLPQLGVSIRATALRRFWTMLAHYHGQIWNGSEFARSFGVADTTVRSYLDLLTSALVVRQLLPWHENIAKRQVKSPKVYISDSGLLHTLLNLRTMADLEGHPKVGASWEGFVLNEIVRRLGAGPEECFFWATHAGAELDLLVVRGKARLGFEIKRTTSPQVSRSMHTAMSDLRLRELTVVHAGEHSFPLGERMRAVALTRILEDVEPLG